MAFQWPGPAKPAGPLRCGPAAALSAGKRAFHFYWPRRRRYHGSSLATPVPALRLIAAIFALALLALAVGPVCAEEAKLAAEDFTQVPNPKPSSARQRSLYAAAAESFSAANKALAEFCGGRGLFEEGAYHAELNKAKPGKPKVKTNTAKAADYIAYRKLAREKYAAVADDWMAYARAAQKEGDQEQYRAGVCQALKTFSDHATARDARGEAFLDALGWLPAERVKALKEASQEGLEPPADPAAFDGRHARPGAGYVLKTVHFAIVSTAPFEKTARLAAGLDPLYDAVAALLGEHAALDGGRIGVFVYGTAAEFSRANADRQGAVWSGGFYRARTGLAHFPMFGEAERSARLTANHELTHAVVDYALRGRPFTAYDGARGKQSQGAFFCAAEGVAMFFEPFDAKAAEQKLTALAGRENTIRAMKEQCRDLDALFSLTAAAWAGDEADTARNYAAAAAFAEFCLAGEGKYRANFVRLLVSHYGRELSVTDFESAFGAKRAEFDAAYRQWLDDRFK